MRSIERLPIMFAAVVALCVLPYCVGATLGQHIEVNLKAPVADWSQGVKAASGGVVALPAGEVMCGTREGMFIVMGGVDGSVTRKLDPNAGQVVACSSTPQGVGFVSLGLEGLVTSFSGKGDGFVKQFELGDKQWRTLAISSNSKLAAVSNAGRMAKILVIDIGSGREVAAVSPAVALPEIFREWSFVAHNLAFINEGKEVLVATSRGIFVVSVASRSMHQVVECGKAGITSSAASASRSQVYFWNEGGPEVYDLRGNLDRRLLDGPSLDHMKTHCKLLSPGPAVFCPNGKLLAIGILDKITSPGWIVLINLEESSATFWKAKRAPVAELCFSRDGESLYSLEHDGTISSWNTESLTAR